jgi:GT2 family glycosyltransferase
VIAVVVPSRNRARSLARLLDALARQTVVPDEVAVVLDATEDASAAMLAARRDPYELRWREQPVRRGAAAARNLGVACTSAPIVLFLDDDVEPEPDCVARHVARHVTAARRVVVGDCPIELPSRPRGHDLSGWSWWLDFNHARASDTRPRTYRDVCAGNLSIHRDDLLAVGGFDEGFSGYGAEDWELGVRLLASGVEVAVEPLAVARHHRSHTVAQLLANTRAEGRADVHFGRRHPELRSRMRLRYPPPGPLGARARAAFDRPWGADRALRVAEIRLTVVRPLRRWWWWFDQLRAEAYWWGVAEALGSWAAYEAFVADVPEVATVVDVRAGLPDRLPVPDGVPCRVVVLWGDEQLGALRLAPSASRERVDVARRIATDLTGPVLLRL